MNKTDLTKSIKSAVKNKPSEFVIDDLKWKFLVRSVLKSKNILLVGSTGCGKTMAAQTVAKYLGRSDNFYYFNLGATQDSRSTLIGNTHFDTKTGTVFRESTFVKAIQQENAIILLDEISRAHPDCVNILMTVLDDLQRYLRLDEKDDCKTIKVANGVTFIATANVGNEYTATRVMDRALLGRFPVKIEMRELTASEEYNMLRNRFDITDSDQLKTLNSLCEIAAHTRTVASTDDGKLSNFIPTRSTVEMAELILDNFTLEEIAETTIYPNFSKEGDVDSERTYVKQLVQKYFETESGELF